MKTLELYDDDGVMYFSECNELVHTTQFEIEKRWGREMPQVVGPASGEYRVKYIEMGAGANCSVHYHAFKHETVVCLRGELTIAFPKLDVKVTLHPGAGVAIPPGEKYQHRMSAGHVGDDGYSPALYLEAAGSTTTGDMQADTIRVEM